MPSGVYKRTPNMRKRMGDLNRGKHLSDETKKKISDSCKIKFASDEYKQNMSIATKKAWQKRKSGKAYKRFKQKTKEIKNEIKEMEDNG